MPCEIADDKGSGLFISPPLGLVSSRGLRAAIAPSREGLARVRIRVKLRMTNGVVFFFPYRTAIRSGLTYIILGAIRTYLQPAVLDHTPCMVGCVCPVESRMTKRVVFYCFDHYE